MTCKTKVELHSTSRTCVFTNWFNFNPWFDCPRSFTLCVKCGYFYVKPWRSSDFTFGECKTIITICNKISNFIRFSRIYYLLKRWITFLTIIFPLVGLRLSKSESYIVLWEADGIVVCKILHYLSKKKKKQNKKYTLVLTEIIHLFIKNQKFAFIWCNYHTSLHPFVSII